MSMQSFPWNIQAIIASKLERLCQIEILKKLNIALVPYYSCANQPH